MKCDSLLLEDYVEGFLEASESQKLEAHLQTCKSCQNEYQQLKNEQQSLLAQLNTPIITYSSQADLIMQRIQTNTKRKKSWNSLKISVISAAILFLSFGLYYWNQMPSDVAQPIDEPSELIEPNSEEQEGLKPGEQTPSLDAPFLDVSIEQVVDDGENVDIEFRVKFNEENQRYYENLHSQLLTRYEYDEFLNPSVDKTEAPFFGQVLTGVHYAIKNDAGELVAGHGHNLKGKPLVYSSTSGRGTDKLGEMIYSISVPSYTKPTILEVFAMEKHVHNLTEIQVNPQQLQPFQFENAEYTVDSVEIENNTLHIQISTEGIPKIRPLGWHIVLDNHLVVADRGSGKFEENRNNNRAIYRAQFNDFEKVPSSFKIVPDAVEIIEDIEPIRLELN